MWIICIFFAFVSQSLSGIMLFILLPVIAAFIGYITNWVAIKMLFHPRKPVKFLFFTVQGIFPKRQQQFAEKLGKLVAEELLSFDDIEEKMTDPQKLKSLKPLVEYHMEEFLRYKLPDSMPVLSMFIGDSTIDKIKTTFSDELDHLFPKLIKKYMHHIKDDLDLEKIVTDKVAAFSSDKLESILYAIMNKEFRFVEIIGGVLGLIIGIIQVLITYWVK